MLAAGQSLVARWHARLSVGAKLALALVLIGIVAGGAIAWGVFRTQSNQIHKDFETRALLVTHAVESAARSHSAPQNADERLLQIVEQQNYVEELTTHEPSVLHIDVYAFHEGQRVIINSSDLELVGSPLTREQEADLAALAPGGALNEETDDVAGETAYELVTSLDVAGQPELWIAVFLSTEDRDQALAAVQRTFARGLLIAIVVAVLLLYGIVWLLVPRRLQRLVRVAERLRGGDYAARVSGASSAGADEINRLFAHFNAMAASIEALHEETVSLARSDPLTGLANRRCVLEQLQREMERARRDGRPLAVAMLDLDGLKAINDKYGHTAGDAALRRVASALTGVARAGDVVSRFGGDEFVVLLPGCDRAALGEVAARFRRAIEELNASKLAENVSVQVTVSAGAAFYREGDTIDSLMQRADLALFDAKNAGRNQVRVAA